ncbi:MULTISPECIES: hypothetical protein [Mammaliicoccus]|jgi:hypothetical protein|uniref:hypothetical protein n=1 Tax=Mammaliicoccus TaxID=2803850 RepID=UPI0011CADE69|nr:MULTISPECIES: hypothetical protein [Mammaliicoccus]WHI54500.1 hypothetical protein PYH59_11740 [Mammaliicoccus lentus]WHI57022.1 hypothetical protein PYH49_11405 [Mammaliicoccus lentus]WHI64868.1 hypothetical protein PYH50_11410 [Mammaliicoccus lentus]WHI85760.1 hypothetical protein PYH60_11415 [Mammaliicoccus lentus]WHI90269.1 hypothetical protein PYH61_11410 [Mammaliicoccus lentus]
MTRMNKKINSIEFTSNGNLYDLRLQETDKDDKVRQYENGYLKGVATRGNNEPSEILVLLKSIEIMRDTDFVIKAIEFEKDNELYELRLQDVSNGACKVRLYKNNEYVDQLNTANTEDKYSVVLIKALSILNANQRRVV